MAPSCRRWTITVEAFPLLLAGPDAERVARGRLQHENENENENENGMTPLKPEQRARIEAELGPPETRQADPGDG
ncbi:hypothetical protein [Erythrobacter sanguineus]|uniref:Uncharacterized protein n=1 Tax=Erythrobacter sanguineus TaxID=198312 RepID=A0A1M7SVS6_9SPHN|nr:hypothetical protein [Erythrobacter sanguineus]SHN62569.1 hypothetical protein SAMN02745193_02460 [Erythrobacter sanguineus]